MMKTKLDLKGFSKEDRQVLPRLKTFLNRFGADLVQVDDLRNLDCPFNSRVGLDRRGHKLLIAKGAGDKWGPHWPSLTHEAAHLLAVKASPSETNEMSMLYWDYCLGRLIAPKYEKSWWAENQDFRLNVGFNHTTGRFQKLKFLFNNPAGIEEVSEVGYIKPEQKLAFLAYLKTLSLKDQFDKKGRVQAIPSRTRC